MRLVTYIFFCSFLISCLPVQAQEMPLTVISNSKGAPPDMKFTVLKSILRGERQRWPDGTKVVIALMKTNTPIGYSTSRKIYDMSGDELNKFWLALVFQGKAQAPTFFNSAADLEAYVAQTPGALGITGGVTNGNTRTVTIEGRKNL